MLNAVGFKPEPKSRNVATSNASILTTASLPLADGARHRELSAHAKDAGHEKRASMQRTALKRGEHAYKRPAPVALLMHV